MRLLLFALHAAPAAPRPRTVLKATTNHYELNQELSARAPDELLLLSRSRPTSTPSTRRRPSSASRRRS